MSSSFSSEGFDLDALPSSGGTDDVVFELGGSATTKEQPKDTNANANEVSNDDESPISRSEEFKGQGNEAFKNNNYLEACDMYTSAIEACPGITGSELLAMHDEFEMEENKKLLERNRLEAEARRREQTTAIEKQDGENPQATPLEEENHVSLQPSEFKAPFHPHACALAIYHCNRAACKMHLGNYDDSVRDCDIAILLRPDWAKAFVRRSAAYEKLGKSEQALSDAKTALEKDPKNATVKKTVARLQKIEDERLEQLKEETMEKLKDLGNSLLSNFGLSLDNFQAKQDENGSYNISFQNG